MDMSDLITIIGMILGAWGGAYAFFYSDIHGQLKANQATREQYADDLEDVASTPKRYRDILGSALKRLTEFYGEPWGGRALSSSISIALIYSFMLFLLSWSVSGNGKIGEIEFLPDSPDLLQRFVIIFAIFLIVTFSYLFLKYGETIIGKVQRLLLRPSFISDNISTKLSILVVVAVVGVGGVGGVGVGGVGAVAAVAAVVVGVGGVVVAAVAAVVVVVGVVVGVVVAAAVVGGGVGIIYMFFFALLPIINGFFDYISLSVSRRLAQKIVDDESHWKVLGHFLLDVGLAVLFFCLIYYGLLLGINGFNSLISDNTMAIPIDGLLEKAFDSPLSPENWWISLMLFSTILPTLTHLLAAFVALSYRVFNPHKKIEGWVTYLRSFDGESPVKGLSDIAHFITSFRRAIPLSLFFVLVLVTFVMIFSLFGGLGSVQDSGVVIETMCGSDS